MRQAGIKMDNPVKIGAILSFVCDPVILGVAIALINFVVIFFTIVTAILPERYDLQVGDILQTPISAPRDVEDTLTTELRIKEAMENVSPIYRLDQGITKRVIDDVNKIFNEVSEVRSIAQQRLEDLKRQQQADLTNKSHQSEDGSNSESENTESQKIGDDQPEKTEQPPSSLEVIDEQFIIDLQAKLSIMLSRDELLTCINAEESELINLQEQLLKTLNKLLGLRIKQDNLLEAKNKLREEIMALPVSNEVRLLGTTIGTSVLKPNMLYDHQSTEAERQRAAQQVEKAIYKKGQYIVQAGQPITREQYEVLKKLGYLKNDGPNIPFLTGIGIAVFITEMLVILYLLYFERHIMRKPLALLLISLIIWMVLGLSRMTSALNIYLVPAALGGMLITILLKPKIAVIVNIALALLLGTMLENHLGIVVMTLTGGMIGIYTVSKAQQRSTLIWAGMAVSGANILAIGSFEMLSSGGWIVPLKCSAWGIGGGIMSAVLLVGTLPIWENLFGIITPIKLVELSNPNNPVLKRLLMEAPGTYHHSIIVANLAESAADAIGANGLLTRVGAYYHDIGKLKKPYYFKENQLGKDNPHDRLDPKLSTHIIISHTKDGIEMAKKYKVPKVLQDFILQHHGTTLVAYFYHKAKNQTQSDELKMEDFRYSGPKPETRETAIVMMADTVEAAVRSMDDPAPEKVECLIRKLIKEKMKDGQLDNCDLTLKDLSSIASAFTGVITGIFHERVKYPDIDINKEKGDQESDARGKSGN